MREDLTEIDWLQIEQAACGCVGGTSDEWPMLARAICKIIGKPFGDRKPASWMQGFCEAVIAMKAEDCKCDGCTKVFNHFEACEYCDCCKDCCDCDICEFCGFRDDMCDCEEGGRRAT